MLRIYWTKDAAVSFFLLFFAFVCMVGCRLFLYCCITLIFFTFFFFILICGFAKLVFFGPLAEKKGYHEVWLWFGLVVLSFFFIRLVPLCSWKGGVASF